MQRCFAAVLTLNRIAAQCAWGLLAAMARVALDANGEEPLAIHPVTTRP